MATLPDMLRAELARCQILQTHYASFGTAGAFAGALLDDALRRAQLALQTLDGEAIQHAVERLHLFRDVMPDPPAAPHRPAGAGHPAGIRLPPGVRAAWQPPHTLLQQQFFTWTRAR